MGKLRAVSSHPIIREDYIFLKSNKRYDEYQGYVDGYQIINVFLNAGHATNVIYAEHKTNLFFHDPAILNLNGIDYLIDRPGMVTVDKGMPYFIRNVNWFRKVKFTKMIKK